MESMESIAAKRVPTAEELWVLLQSEGGRLTLTNPTRIVRSRMRRALYTLINGDLITEGYRVKHTGRDRGDLVISLVKIEDDPRPTPPPEAIPIPTSLRGAHPAVRLAEPESKSRSGWVDTRAIVGAVHMNVQAGNVRRALLLVQALINDAERRGYTVKVHPGFDCKGGLWVGVNGHEYEILIKETQKRTDRTPTADEVERKRKYGWDYSKWDLVPSGRLEIRRGHDTYSSPLASDRERWKLEDRLSTVFTKLEGMAAAAEVKRVQAEQKAIEDRKGWEIIRAEAIECVREDYRVQWLSRQIRRQRKAERVHDYVDGIRSTRELTEHEDEWLRWVDNYARGLDPKTSDMVPPPMPEPKPKQLQPYMQGWSATEPTAPFRWSLS